MNENRNTIDAAAAIAGRSSGSVTSRNARQRRRAEHPGRLLAAAGRGAPTAPPTVRTTTAKLKNTWATTMARDRAVPAVGQQGEERRADHDGRQHERHGHDGQQHAAAGERVAGDDEGHRQARATSVSTVLTTRLPEREPGDRAQAGVA